MGRVTITFYPSDRKQSKTTMQIPIYLRIRKENLKTEARTELMQLIRSPPLS